jgi:hypothetical protein
LRFGAGCLLNPGRAVAVLVGAGFAGCFFGAAILRLGFAAAVFVAL